MSKIYTEKDKLLKRFLREFGLTKAWEDYLRTDTYVRHSYYPDEIFGTSEFSIFIDGRNTDMEINTWRGRDVRYSISSLFRLFVYAYYYNDFVLIRDSKDRAYFRIRCLRSYEVKKMVSDHKLIQYLSRIGGEDEKALIERLNYVVKLLSNSPLTSCARFETK